MIYGFLHQGSGIGNQLHRYVATRVKAKELGVDYRMVYNPDGSGKKTGFKADDFIKFDYSKMIALHELPPDLNTFIEKKVVENGVDIRSYDPEFNFIQDNTIIDGEFQDERYWRDHAVDVDNWLATSFMRLPDDLCIINFRGGEYSVFPDLYLTKEYWEEAMDVVKKDNPSIRFQIHTDDPLRAKEMLPGIETIQDAEMNWKAIRFAKNIIIANSSFAIFPAWLNMMADNIIAPRYWARRNTGVWALPQNYYSRFTYI